MEVMGATTTTPMMTETTDVVTEEALVTAVAEEDLQEVAEEEEEEGVEHIAAQVEGTESDIGIIQGPTTILTTTTLTGTTIPNRKRRMTETRLLTDGLFPLLKRNSRSSLYRLGTESTTLPYCTFTKYNS